ncbi:HAD family hydrolase [Dyella psychrodurans]|uniref:Haloacid dehalogenase-like hydrolase n=1 Tax=Dyella psychrodurans TaxID=1927960 RepID=A0A370X327_9GAMM|nr:HAD family hydrolase [Dyella psychrodurans]RDS82625.1 haloacid dehalogenase-like hydrolase [Dyella psychrodurans]
MFTGDKTAAPEHTGAEARASRIVVFDFDGVLFHGDSFSMFMRHRFKHSLLSKLLALLTMPWWLLCLVFSRWWAARALVHVALFGMGQKRYQQAVDAFVDQAVRRPRQFCRDGLQTLRKHVADGDEVIVVTGCEQTLAARLLSQIGLPDIGVIGSQLKPGWSGLRISLHNVGRRKVQSLVGKGVKSWRVAYGDSMLDAQMLKQAHEAVLVNGSPKLCKRMERALGRTVARVDWY